MKKDHPQKTLTPEEVAFKERKKTIMSSYIIHRGVASKERYLQDKAYYEEKENKNQK